MNDTSVMVSVYLYRVHCSVQSNCRVVLPVSFPIGSYFKTSGFWPRVRARALRAPVFLSLLLPQTGALRAPSPSPIALLFLFDPQKYIKIYRTWAAYVKGFFLSTEAMKYEVPCPAPPIAVSLILPVIFLGSN
jgi:hypothetical protein